MLKFRFSNKSQKATVLSTVLFFLKKTPATHKGFSSAQFLFFLELAPELCYIVNLTWETNRCFPCLLLIDIFSVEFLKAIGTSRFLFCFVSFALLSFLFK